MNGIQEIKKLEYVPDAIVHIGIEKKGMQKATDFELIESYSRLKNVWKVAQVFNMCGQSVWERLSKRGIIESDEWSEKEDAVLKDLYGSRDSSISLNEIALKMGRSRAAIACRASNLKITSYKRPATELCRENMINAGKERIKKYGHPRGNLGKKFSEETKKIIGKKSKVFMNSCSKEYWEKRAEKALQTRIKNGTLNTNKNQGNPYSRTRGGKRPDLDNKFFRSTVEANYARYMNFLGYEWEYEPKDFYFEGIRRGSVSFTPDFYNKTLDKWIEVKGWFDSRSITKIKRFRKYFPEESSKLLMVTQSRKSHEIALSLGLDCYRYELIFKKFSSVIPSWEFPK